MPPGAICGIMDPVRRRFRNRNGCLLLLLAVFPKAARRQETREQPPDYPMTAPRDQPAEGSLSGPAAGTGRGGKPDGPAPGLGADSARPGRVGQQADHRQLAAPAQAAFLQPAASARPSSSWAPRRRSPGRSSRPSTPRRWPSTWRSTWTSPRVQVRFVISTPDVQPLLGEKPLPLQQAAASAAAAPGTPRLARVAAARPRRASPTFALTPDGGCRRRRRQRWRRARQAATSSRPSWSPRR